MRVALFATCLVDGLFPDVGRATLTVLERLGAEVDVPLGQTCCGQMHINSGYSRAARDIVRAQVWVLEGYDAVVVPSASCAGSIRHQWPIIAADDPVLAAAVEHIGRRTYELTEFLVDVLAVTDVGARYPHRVTYHPTCHSLRQLRVGDRPERMLSQVRDIEVRELPDCETCCGFGGTFALKNADTSAAMLADKLTAIDTSAAEVVAAIDASCLMHIGGGLSRNASPVRAVHVAEILAAT